MDIPEIAMRIRKASNSSFHRRLLTRVYHWFGLRSTKLYNQAFSPLGLLGYLVLTAPSSQYLIYVTPNPLNFEWPRSTLKFGTPASLNPT